LLFKNKMSDNEFEDDVYDEFKSDEEEEEEDAGDDEDPYQESGELTNAKYMVSGPDRRGTKILFRPEFSRSVETRAAQISNGSPVGIDTKHTDSLDIAEEELRLGKCPLFIDRPSLDGKKFERWHTSELQIINCGKDIGVKTPIQQIREMSFEDLIRRHTSRDDKYTVWPKITAPSSPGGISENTPRSGRVNVTPASGREKITPVPEGEATSSGRSVTPASGRGGTPVSGRSVTPARRMPALHYVERGSRPQPRSGIPFLLQED
jgi:DNA-directed RNA polymerase subunit K/omega